MPKKVVINFNDKSAGKYQIYPSEELSRMIEKYRRNHPARMSTSAAICCLLHERLSQINAPETIGKK